MGTLIFVLIAVLNGTPTPFVFLDGRMACRHFHTTAALVPNKVLWRIDWSVSGIEKKKMVCPEPVVVPAVLTPSSLDYPISEE
jgi:hypothetical protein